MANNFVPIKTTVFENAGTVCQTILSAVTNDVNKIVGKGSAAGRIVCTLLRKRDLIKRNMIESCLRLRFGRPRNRLYLS